MNLIKSEKTANKVLQKAAKKLGLLNDQTGIIKRYINEEGNWNDHLLNCKNYIANAAKSKKNNKCAVLGSGWLIDVPIDFLTSHFKEVCLFDIHHPQQVISKVKTYSNVTLFNEDLTGGALLWIYNNHKQLLKNKSTWLNNLKINTGISFSDFDFVISVNLLNQLDILLADYLRKKLKYNEDELILFRKMIQENHIQILPQNKSCLITDYEEILINDNNEETEVKNLIYTDLKILKNKKIWEWKFDSHKAYNANYITYLKVIAGEI